MDKAEHSVIIKKVNAKTFDDFLGLIDKLAEYEKLASPDEAAKRRLRRDCLTDKPKYEAFIGKVEGKPISYVIFSLPTQVFLLCQLCFLKIFLSLKNTENKV